jgi:diaminohydroxyphosphoribosylaminopyrimidine deaminase/5-amino-6-(5-phosphoribosylamino)uracil reductase
VSRPMTIGHLGQSLDGFIATHTGESQFVTGEQNIVHLHRMRALCDAVVVGAGTVAADDPELTCRLPGLGAYSPVRIVLDSKAGLAEMSKLAKTARQVPVWLLCTSAAEAAKRAVLRKAGGEVIEVAAAGDGRVDVAAAAQALGQRGLTRVLVEGGGQVAAAFLKAGLIDRITSYRAGLVLGADGRSAVGELGFNRLDFAPRFRLVSVRPLQGDTVESWTREA